MIRLKHFDLKIGAEIFKAFSDESRIRIMNLIFRNKEMCISDLELILDFTQTKTSRQLSTLKNSGVLRYKKVDQWAYYFINETYYEIIAQLFTFLEKDPLLLKDQEEYRTLYSNNELAVRKLHNKLKIYHLPEL
ncbi:metalloregulator ArsR/SmtB family transcription factor [Sporocytophaga myxococcoides]|uniref:metalloregulator ArsR/SmtB family transcription factor n=1 Tax=Sporocytophaga myxococcoides TaxID=153721 RepID=UPI00040C7614